MKKTTPPNIRKTLNSALLFFSLFTLLSSACFATGFLGGMDALDKIRLKTSIDPNLIIFVIGLVGFIFSFPTMVSLYVANVVLSRIEEIEKRHGDMPQ
jgi:hypothetical protein